MSTERTSHRLRDIQTHCQYIIEDTAHLNFDEFLANRVVRQAVERNITIIGIAAGRLRDDDFETFGDIEELTQAIGMRNRLAHGYDDQINDEVIWETATVSIPRLLQKVNALI